MRGRAGRKPALTSENSVILCLGAMNSPSSLRRISYVCPSRAGMRQMTLLDARAASSVGNTPLYSATPFFCIRICGFTTHSGSLTLPFFRLSRNALDFSISAFMAAMVSVLGAGMVFVISPYRTCHVTADASSNSGKSSAFWMRRASKVMSGSVICSLAPPY